ncbi:hypothetical protein [Paraburkholderia sp. HP33-1]|uniref:hypothetical protein n=1 Tax=Paraburkholderia sp. HP33-1 TaxID=2883243 RepID=UPI001F1AE76F|nr:hypothetical protein [Paraburkholderia sp. HP33-1]
MKGRTVFSASDADRVRALLSQVRDADRDQQKALRDRLRKELGFYISDFTGSNAGFTAADFDSLVIKGTVKIE